MKILCYSLSEPVFYWKKVITNIYIAVVYSNTMKKRLSKRFMIIATGIAILSVINFVFAADVAYISKYKNYDTIIVDVFEDLGFNVSVIMDDDIPHTDFDEFKFIFLGDGKMSHAMHIPDDVPIIIANHFHAKQFGLVARGNLMKVAANSILKVMSDDETIEAYDQSSASLGGVALPYYYIPDKFKTDQFISVARAVPGSRMEGGDVVAFGNNSKKCFFGVIETRYWTDDIKELFSRCVNHVSTILEHDVMIDETYSNAVNGIRIQDDETNNYLLDETAQLTCNKKYKVDFRTKNVGDFTETVKFTGNLSTFGWTATKTDLEAGITTTTGSKTINITFAEGMYNLTIKADIENDANLDDNMKTREVEVVC